MILVTGASGLLGANLMAAAQDRGMDVCGTTRGGGFAVPGAQIFQAALYPGIGKHSLADLIVSESPKCVIHCAAWAGVDACEADPERAMRENAEAAGLAARAAANAGADFVFISTDSVFSGEGSGARRETDSPAPPNAYAKSKLEGEQAVAAAHPSALILRANFYGWNARPKLSLGEWILAELEAGRAVPGFEDVIFAPLAASDFAGLILDMAAARLSGVYHVASRDSISKYDFARAVAHEFGFAEDRVLKTRIQHSSLRAPRPKRTALNPAKAEASLGRPMPGAAEGIRNWRESAKHGLRARLRSFAA